MNPVISTQRLWLRELTLEDLPYLFSIISDEDTMSYYPRPFTYDESKAWIEKSIRSYKENGYGLWALIDREEEIFIGQSGISDQNIDGETLPEIGYQLHKKYWNRGLATESALASLDYGFKVLKLPELYIHTHVNNIPARRVAQKIGMRYWKEFHKSVHDGSYVIPMVAYVKEANY